MPDDVIKRDSNSVTVLAGVTDDVNAFIKMLPIDPVTGRLKVSATIAGVSYGDNETPTGTVNGSNATFTLANAPSPAASLQLFVNGMLQVPGGVDYTLTSSTITFVSAPLTGSYIRAYYRY